MRVLGIDPGLATIGWGALEIKGRRIARADFGVVTTPPLRALAVRLALIEHALTALMASKKPDVIAIEELFFAKNRKTAFAVAQARGVILAAAARVKGAEIIEITPSQVKQYVAFSGRARKQEVGARIQTLLRLAALPKPDDAADALAIALCAALQKKPLIFS